MKEYIKPEIDMVELIAEERLACDPGSSGGGDDHHHDHDHDHDHHHKHQGRHCR